MRTARHARRSLVAVLTATLTLTLMLTVTRAAPTARADDSQDVTIAEAAAQAAVTGQPVLATAETTETSSVVANPDGTLTATLGAGPLQEPDPSSDTGWAPIDLSLQHVDGTYAPAVSAADTTFSDGGAGALATLDQGSTTYTENWDGTLPSPTVSGDTATYANVLANIDLVMTAQTTGFKQSFVLKVAPTHQLTLDVPLSLRGLSATVDDDGNLIVTDTQGNTVATSSTAVMYGAAMDPSGEPTISSTVDTAIVNGQHGPVFEISPDPSFFANPELTYPVTIDPSPNLNDTTDTYVRKSTPTTSYYTDNVLKVGTPDTSGDIMRALLKFPALDATYRGNANPIDVSSATLSLYQIDANSCAPTAVDLYDAASSWTPSVTAVTWSNQPDPGTLYASASAAYGHSGCPSNGWVYISTGGAGGLALKDIVQNWADGSVNDGLIVKAASESDKDYWKKFRSTEQGSNIPYLSVTYNTVPDVPPNLATDQSDPNKPVLSAKYVDPDGDSGSVEFTLNDDSGHTLLLSSTTIVASGSAASLVVPLRTLTDGGAYQWRARSYDGADYSAFTSWQFLAFDSKPGTPTDLSTQDGPRTLTASPTIVGMYHDPNGGSGSLDFRVMDSSCTSTIATGTGAAVPDGMFSVWTPSPPLALAMGAVYGIEAQAIDVTTTTSGWTSCAQFFAGIAVSATAPADQTISTDLTPNLSANLGADAPAPQALTFEIYRDDDDLLAATGTGTTAAPGTSSVWTVPTGSLSAGHAYWWVAYGLGTTETPPVAYFVVPAGLYLTITSPADCGVIGGDQQELQATPTGFDSVSAVDYYIDGDFIGEATQAPYSVIWTLPPADSSQHELWAFAAGYKDGHGVEESSTAHFTLSGDIDGDGASVGPPPADPGTMAGALPAVPATDMTRPTVTDATPLTHVSPNAISQYAVTHTNNCQHKDSCDYYLHWNRDYWWEPDDCTNYVSQALYAGGWTFVRDYMGDDYEWYYNFPWWYHFYKMSPSWGRSHDLAFFVTTAEGYWGRGSWVWQSHISNVRPGDLIAFAWGGSQQDDPGINHWAVVTWVGTEHGNDGHVYWNFKISSHVNNRQDWPYYWEGGESKPSMSEIIAANDQRSGEASVAYIYRPNAYYEYP